MEEVLVVAEKQDLISNIDYKSNNSPVTEIDINKIEPNKNQPRKYFDNEALQDLAESIRQYGIIQPLILKAYGDYYTIVAGERRWRAARLAKLNKLPAIIKDYTDVEMIQVALIENVQRENLNPIEEAQCYRRLIEEFSFTHDTIAQKVSKARTTITMSLRLLALDSRVQMLVLENKLYESHARALIPIQDKNLQFETAKEIIEQDLSVRQCTQHVKNLLENLNSGKKSEPPKRTPAYQTIERDLKVLLGTPVSIKERNKKGKIEILYHSHDELDRILSMFRNLDDAERN